MTMNKPLRQIAWDHEFEPADGDARATHGRLERVRRIAAYRAARPEQPSALPKPCAQHRQREVSPAGHSVPNLSRHGRTRLQQRGIELEQVMTVLDYGREQRAHGASRYFLDRRGREQLAVEMPSAMRQLRTLDIHVVMSDEGSLITAAHRTRRIRRQIQHTRRRTHD